MSRFIYSLVCSLAKMKQIFLQQQASCSLYALKNGIRHRKRTPVHSNLKTGTPSLGPPSSVVRAQLL